MYRTHTCGQLRAANVNETVTLAGWVQKVRNLGAMTFIDLRDRYGITQIVVEEHSPADVKTVADGLGREYVLQVEGRVVERSSKNPKMPTGDIEVVASKLVVLHEAEVPPFTIEENSDGGDDLRMKYRYLDLRRPPLQRNMILRHKMAQEIRRFLSDEGFLEIETPYLVNSTPEGARDFVVPSRMSPNQFYALPQSPQTLKQLLMVAGYDKYFQIVRCFRDEDLRADRQPEFTQIDCEMSFVEQEDVLEIFERWAKHMFREVMGIELTEPPRRMPWIEAMEKYGSDKPDLRFGMEFADLTDLAQGHGFAVFDDAEYVTGFAATGCAGYTRKQIDALTEFVKRQQIGAKGLVWIRVEADGNVKSSVDKFYSPEQVRAMAERAGAKSRRPGADPLRQEIQDPHAALRPCVWRSLSNWACATRRNSLRCGSSTSRCSSGTTKPSATTPYTIRSPRPSSKTYNTWTATPVACGPTPTTSSATAPRSAAARSVSTTRNCRPRCSSCWASRRNKRRSVSAS